MVTASQGSNDPASDVSSKISQAVTDYYNHGLHVISLPYGQKDIHERKWSSREWTANQIINDLKIGPLNLALDLNPVNGIVDVDIDNPITASIAHQFLPNTSMIHGRPSNPRSHYWYRTDEPTKYRKYIDPVTKQCLIEVRTGYNKYTIIPPSQHPTGEHYTWNVFQPDHLPTESAKRLDRVVAVIAACALLAEHWPAAGSRQDSALALTGALLAHGWTGEQAGRALTAILQAAGDGTEIDRRLSCIESTRQAIESGSRITGFGKLTELFGIDIVRTVRKWLNIINVTEKIKVTESINYDPTMPQLTDMGNAIRFADMWENGLIYVQDQLRWYSWDGNVWKPLAVDPYDQAFTTIKTLYSIASDIWESNEEQAQAIHRWAKQSESARSLKAMIDLARASIKLARTSDQLDLNPWLMNAQNSIIDLRTQQPIPAEPQHYMTRQSPVAYVPTVDCPTWKTMIQTISQKKLPDGSYQRDRDMELYIQRVLGYTMTGITDERCFIVMFGDGKNGKSTILSRWQMVLGNYAKKMHNSTLMVKRNEGIPADIAELGSIRFAYASEGSSGQTLDTALIKELTGGEPMNARFLYGQWFNLNIQAKIIFGTNALPSAPESDHAFWDRLIGVPFEYRYTTDQRPRFEIDRMFDNEMSGILNWGLEGIRLWQIEGSLNPPKRVLEATEAYQDKASQFRQFLRTCATGPNLRIRHTNLYAFYTTWCDDNGAKAVNKATFESRMAENGYHTETDKKGSLWWFGIRSYAENEE
jgi:P4 family phage/plasmid primase-like protien